MEEFYNHHGESLAGLLRDAGAGVEGATLLIPDLQRPYVWSPKQVIRLVDSLIRGWPFGSLLIWNIGHKPSEEVQIPHRAFWTEHDQIEDGKQVHLAGLPTNKPARMVLDGQQRLQSLLLAVGGDDWGMRRRDEQWREDLERPRLKRKMYQQYWSRGQLCFDLEALAVSLQSKRALDYEALLGWAMTTQTDQTDPKNDGKYVRPLPSFQTQRGRWLRFSKLWRIAAEVTRQSEITERLDILLDGSAHAASVNPGVREELVELVRSLAEVMQRKVPVLEIKSPQELGQLRPDDYNEAIVSIFARLNSAGRTLTPQEITFAWVKSLWPKSSTVTAREQFESLQAKLETRWVSMPMDDVVQSVGAVWGAATGRPLLQRGDLLRRDRIEPMVLWSAERWATLDATFCDVADWLDEIGLRYGNDFRSLNALRALWSLVAMARFRGANHGFNSVQRTQFEDRLREWLKARAPRWLMVTMWARSSQADGGAEFAAHLAKHAAAFSDSTSVDGLFEAMDTAAEAFLKPLLPEARSFVSELDAPARQVTRYNPLLWVWNRLDQARFDWCRKPLQSGGSGKAQTFGLQVDHVVPAKFWSKVTIAEDAVDGNELGNCVLLTSNFNIAKGAATARSFLLSAVDAFKNDPAQVAAWATCFAIPDVLLDADPKQLATLQQAIEIRTKLIRDDLGKFIDGTAKLVPLR